jgi:8-oxo-dGTP diphosphatase
MALPIDVAVGVVIRADGAVLIGQRIPGKPYAGWWEFPGGKLESGESVAQALARELREELGLEDVESVPWVVRYHVYPHASVRLHFRRVVAWRGDPQSREGQALVWRPPEAIDVAPLLPAAIAPIAWLQLPPVYAISCAAEMGVAAFERALEARLASDHAAPGTPPMLLQLREPTLSAVEFDELFSRLLSLRERHRLQVLVSSRHPSSYAATVDGMHLTARDLAAASARPDMKLVGASCHDAEDIARAAAMGCDLAVFGPVRATPSHPGAVGLGWTAAEAALHGAQLPVYAIGGLGRTDVERARRAGAHGVASMRAGWRD